MLTWATRFGADDAGQAGRYEIVDRWVYHLEHCGRNKALMKLASGNDWWRPLVQRYKATRARYKEADLLISGIRELKQCLTKTGDESISLRSLHKRARQLKKEGISSFRVCTPSAFEEAERIANQMRGADTGLGWFKRDCSKWLASPPAVPILDIMSEDAAHVKARYLPEVEEAVRGLIGAIVERVQTLDFES